MRAMVLAAGIGSRLRPLTDTTPKALIDVGGQTMIERVFRRLMAAGAEEIIVNLHHHADKIAAFLEEKRGFGARVELSREPMLLETGGGLKKAASFLSDGRPFLVHNVDVLSEIDLAALYRAHEAEGALATLAVQKRDGKRLLSFDARGRLSGRCEDASGMGFCGVHVVSPGIFPKMTETGVFSITDVYLRLAAAGENIRGFDVGAAYWADIGTDEKLRRARARFQSHR